MHGEARRTKHGGLFKQAGRTAAGTYWTSRYVLALTSGEESQNGGGTAIPQPERVNTSSKKVRTQWRKWWQGKKGPGRTRQGSKRQHRTLSPAVCLLDLLPNQVRWQ